MWKYCISIEGLGRGMWKDFVAINGSECVRALICIAIDDPGGGRRLVSYPDPFRRRRRKGSGYETSRRQQSSALTPTPNRLYGSDSKSY